MTTEYFTLAELRALPDMDDDTAYPDARVDAAAAYIVGVIEREVGTSFIVRSHTDEAHDGGAAAVVPASAYVRGVTQVKVNGVVSTSTIKVRNDAVYRVSGSNSTPVDWPEGIGNIEVTYTSGYSSAPPADIKEIALKGTRAHLLANSENSMMNDRRTSLNTDMGVVGFVIAGENRPTGYPEVDAAILGWKRRLDVLGFA